MFIKKKIVLKDVSCVIFLWILMFQLNKNDKLYMQMVNLKIKMNYKVWKSKVKNMRDMELK